MKNFINILITLSLILFYSCSASTDSRYGSEKKDTEEEEIVVKDKKESVEDFDFTPYRTRLDIPKKEIFFPIHTPKSEIWYGYEDTGVDTSLTSTKKIIDNAQGYRVLVLSTDNLEEANNMRSEIYFNTSEKEVYVIFDPPFYKVMVGDFTEYSEAKNLSFKLNQLGYSESRVVNEIVNIFE